ncbi:MAG: sulfatase-like hydrolase/transferase [Vicinamibacteria bacterium]|nr:sulfatase-like hydrolase/transferase [Vicinamibacteria bacterium]
MAKAIAVVLMCGLKDPLSWALTMAKVLSRDLFFLAGIAFAFHLSSCIRALRLLQALALSAMCAAYILVILWTFLNVGFFAYLGTGLHPDLLLLAPAMISYLLKSISAYAAFMMGLAIMIAMTPILAFPWLLRWTATKTLRFGYLLLVAAGFLAGIGFALEMMPIRTQHEASLRELSALSALIPNWQAFVDKKPPTPEQHELVCSLMGTPDRSARDVLSRLPRRRYSVIIWVAEGVGERYLASYHPFGVAKSPNLDSIAHSGSLRFTRAFTECPLSVQVFWSMMSGRSPPGSPLIFMARELPLPDHPSLLPTVLARHGYRTSYFNGSFLRAWGEERIAREAVQVFEDAETMAEGALLKSRGWSIDGDVMVARFSNWLGTVPVDTPFFSVIWPAETHHPYRWQGMPQELDNAKAETRYRAAIERCDSQLGRLWQAIMSAGRRHETILIFIGDHGEGLARHGHPDDLAHSLKVYEDDLHVPFILVHPALHGQSTSSASCVHADIYPTLLDLLDLPEVEGLGGIDLARDVPPRLLVARSILWWPAAIRAGHYKLILSDPGARAQLFDWVEDPGETQDLSGSEPAITDALSATLAYHHAIQRRVDTSFKASRDLPRSWFAPAN